MDGAPKYLAELLGPPAPAIEPAGRSVRRDAYSRVGDSAPWPGTGLLGLGRPVSPADAAGVPAIHQAVRLASQGVARLRLVTWQGRGVERRRMDAAWQSLLFEQPNDRQTRFEFLETVEQSLSFRGNAWIWKNVDPQTRRVVELWALHPDQVVPRERTFDVIVGGGFVDPTGRADRQGRIADVGPDRLLHIRGHGGGALMVAPSPVQLFADTIGAAIAKTVRERAFYENGAEQAFVLSLPPEVTPEQAEEFSELWHETYGGPRNSGKTPVAGGGAQPKPIALTQRDSQFIESMALSVEDAARIFNVTPSLLGVQRSDRPLSPEHEEDRWLRYGLGPRLERIEAAAKLDPDLFPAGARVYPAFDTDQTVRGDITTESEMLVREVQAGIRLVDEARALRGLPPLPDGQGQVPQITPVGGAPNQTPPPPSSGDEEDDDAP